MSGGSATAWRPHFDRAVPAGGYAWWYVDALSDDGAHGITLIAFVGSVFSPYYAWARRRGAADPRNHCALNIAVYGGDTARWAMTERGAASLRQSADMLRIGSSSLHWDRDALIVDLDERCAPLPRRIRGQVRLLPHDVIDCTLDLDHSGRHRWTPIAPSARVEVALSSPALRWTGDAYFDGNHGDEPLERQIRGWHWSRCRLRRETAVIYDVAGRDGSTSNFALRFGDGGQIDEFAPPPPCELPRSAWHVNRATRSDDGRARVERTLEDTPFYARSVISARIRGEMATSMHESLDLDRFRRPIVQAMLPFRMPRSRRKSI